MRGIDYTDDEAIATVANNFKYHAPQPTQAERYTEIRDEAGGLARTILRNCPPSRERSVALTNLEQTSMWANAAIARNETFVKEEVPAS